MLNLAKEGKKEYCLHATEHKLLQVGEKSCSLQYCIFESMTPTTGFVSVILLAAIFFKGLHVFSTMSSVMRPLQHASILEIMIQKARKLGNQTCFGCAT